MFKEGTCPRCHEKIQVPDDRDKVLCMYCGEEISVKKALGEEKKTDYVAYGENYNRALEGLQQLIRMCYRPMQDFKKNLYEGVFQNFYSQHRAMFESMEYVYQQEEEPDVWLGKMFSCIIESAQEDLRTYKFKGQRNQRLLDYNFLISVYLIPAVLKYPAEVSEPFADGLIREWNKTFDTSIGKARFDDIESGFHRKLCYITTAVCESLGKGENCYELNILKEYRDRYLESTEEGHALVEAYYDIAPTIVKRIDRQKDREVIYQNLYEEYLLPCIQKIERQDYEACKEQYQRMVLNLKAQYIS